MHDTCNIFEDIKLLAICRSRGLSGTRDSCGISCKSSPRTPNHLTLQAGNLKRFFSFYDLQLEIDRTNERMRLTISVCLQAHPYTSVFEGA